ncbi:MAG TPA: RodZ domain-containing protein [Gallionella sp.]|nr:RodZ domain-containing protein [Gallionella sp.]
MMEQQNENSQAPAENIEAAAPVRAGTALREARERLGLSVADAAAQTKLAPRQIEALEADDYHHLPEMAFVRGFVRSYAKVLQIDVQPLLAALPQAHIVTHVSPASVEVPFLDARSPQLQNLIWLGAALFLSVVVVAFAVWHYTSPSTPDESRETSPVEAAIPLPAQMQVIPASAVEEAEVSSVASAVPAAQSAVSAAQSAVPAAQAAPVAAMPSVKQPLAVSAVKPVPVAAKTLPVSAVAAAKPAPVATKPLPVSAVDATKTVAAPAKPLPASAVTATKPAPLAAKPQPVVPAVKPAVPAATTQPANLRLTFGEESWTEVRDRNGNIVSSQLNPAGSELRLSGQGPFSLVVGRASSARLTYKGKTVDLKPNTNATSDVARVTLE